MTSNIQYKELCDEPNKQELHAARANDNFCREHGTFATEGKNKNNFRKHEFISLMSDES